jgi:transcriptional regulator with XRE-family HTH domain
MFIASAPFTHRLSQGSPEPALSENLHKMNNHNDVVKMSEALPLPLLDLRVKIATAKNLHPERLGTLYPRYCSVMKQIREEKDLSVEQLSALSGLSENFLQAAESGTVEFTDDNLNALQGVYWELSIGEDTPRYFKRLADQRLATPYPEISSAMREIRERKELSIKELSALSGVPDDILEAAESGKVAMIGDNLEDAQRVYWSLSALEATPADYRGLLADMEMKANEH